MSKILYCDKENKNENEKKKSIKKPKLDNLLFSVFHFYSGNFPNFSYVIYLGTPIILSISVASCLWKWGKRAGILGVVEMMILE